MSKPVPSRWAAGQSGNPKGRRRNTRTLTELLRQEGDEIVQVGDTVLSKHEVLAKAMWQYVLTGEVKLAGETLKAKNAGEWVQAIKWLTERLEPSGRSMKPEPAPEMVVRVIRTDKTRPRVSLYETLDGDASSLDPFASERMGEGESRTSPPDPLSFHAVSRRRDGAGEGES